jgi:hypothetical protein
MPTPTTTSHRLASPPLASAAAKENEVLRIDDDGDSEEEGSTKMRLKSSKWDNLDPKIKARIAEQGQQRAIRNKEKRESAQDRKRRT